MVSQTHIHAGPSGDDPLTEDELRILLALPRAARSTPHSLLFRIPRGERPDQGYVDVTCQQAYCIVLRQIVAWHARLSALVGDQVGPGLVVSLMISPPVHALFLHLALWALGCSVQYVTTKYGDEVSDRLLEGSGCKVMVYFGESPAWAAQRRKQLGVETAELDEIEYAGALAIEELANPGREVVSEWPTPQRPSPAIIIQSSATCGNPKLMSFDLHFYTFDLSNIIKQHLGSSSHTKRPQTHPRLIYCHPIWQAFHRYFLVHLVTATPLALVLTPENIDPMKEDLATWIKAFDIGGVICSPPRIRHFLFTDAYTELFQGLYAIEFMGSNLDQSMADIIAQKQLKVANTFGMSELGRVLATDRAPHTYLRPCPEKGFPLAVPLSDPGHDCNQSGGRDVQLWLVVDSYPQLAHIVTRGGVPLQLEPFPGPGPAHGRLAVNLQDVFRESYTEGGDVLYKHIGRQDDFLLLNGGDATSATRYELEMRSALESSLRSRQWVLDTVQMFGTNLSRTALVVQLCGQGVLDNAVMETVRRSAEVTNDRLGLTGPLRVDPVRRLLITTKDGRASTIPEFAHLRLSCTHKLTLRRWHNAKTFEPWLERCAKHTHP